MTLAGAEGRTSPQLKQANGQIAQLRGHRTHRQHLVEALIEAGDFTVFPDALRFAQALAAAEIPLAVTSSSKNANQMMGRIPLPPDRTLLDLFATNVCGRDLARGKSHPEIFLTAAAELHAPRALPGRRGRHGRHRGGARRR